MWIIYTTWNPLIREGFSVPLTGRAPQSLKAYYYIYSAACLLLQVVHVCGSQFLGFLHLLPGAGKSLWRVTAVHFPQRFPILEPFVASVYSPGIVLRLCLEQCFKAADRTFQNLDVIDRGPSQSLAHRHGLDHAHTLLQHIV